MLSNLFKILPLSLLSFFFLLMLLVQVIWDASISLNNQSTILHSFACFWFEKRLTCNFVNAWTNFFCHFSPLSFFRDLLCINHQSFKHVAIRSLMRLVHFSNRTVNVHTFNAIWWRHNSWFVHPFCFRASYKFGLKRALLVWWFLLESLNFLLANENLLIELFWFLNRVDLDDFFDVSCIDTLVALSHYLLRLFKNFWLESCFLHLLLFDLLLKFFKPLTCESALEKKEVFWAHSFIPDAS